MAGNRTSNFELLRIAAMLSIIAGHFLGQTEAMDVLNGVNKIVAAFTGDGSRIAVNIFLMLGIYFMVDSKFKATRVLKLWGQVITYTVPLTLIMLLLGVNVSIKHLIVAFLPITGMPLWFASVYILLYCLSPLLNKFFSLSIKQQQIIIFIMFWWICCVSTISKFVDDRYDAFIWFVFIYFFIGHYKKYIKYRLKSNAIFLVIGIVIYSILVIGSINLLEFASGEFVSVIFKQWIGDFKSLPNFLIAFCIFLFFEKWSIGCNRIINYIASGAFGVYIFHQVPVFYDFLWHSVFRCDSWLESKYFVPYYLGVILITYLIGFFIDTIRNKYIEPIWVNSKLFETISVKINSIYELEKGE